MTTIPATVTTNSEGGFSGVTFTVPSEIGLEPKVVGATQGTKVSLNTFNVSHRIP